MPDTKELAMEPCPFCGSANIDPEGWASTNAEGENYRTGPACDDCGATADSVVVWNTRQDLASCGDSVPSAHAVPSPEDMEAGR